MQYMPIVEPWQSVAPDMSFARPPAEGLYFNMQ